MLVTSGNNYTNAQIRNGGAHRFGDINLMYKALRERVLRANLLLKEYGLITLTWGNVSEIDREAGVVAIKPSGVSYDEMTVDDIVVVDLCGNVVWGKLNPSSDTPTHLELYKRFPAIGGITHTHSRWATVYAQAHMSIPALGTTHADAFYGDVPCTRELTKEEISGEYERNTGVVIAEAFTEDTIMNIPAVLVASHAPFTWGKNAKASVENSVILEEVAFMAWHTVGINPDATMDKALLDKHFLRKHGAGAYYGQGGKK